MKYFVNDLCSSFIKNILFGVSPPLLHTQQELVGPLAKSAHSWWGPIACQAFFLLQLGPSGPRWAYTLLDNIRTGPGSFGNGGERPFFWGDGRERAHK